MARFRTTASFYSDAIGVGRVRAGRTVSDSQANALPGDVVWVNLNAQSLPAGFTPLDAAADAMKAASRWVNTLVGIACHGVDSVDG